MTHNAMADQITLSVTEPGAATVAVHGNLMSGIRHVLKQKVLDAIAEQGVRQVTLDFAGCPYIDSAGLGVQVVLARKLHEIGGTLRVINLNDDLRTLYMLTHLDGLFDSVASIADATGAS
jgi:anti-sigma B factor antagonist